MPYIKNSRRAEIESYTELSKFITRLSGLTDPLTVGDLNYIITKITRLYLKKDFNYKKINDVIGVLECAKLELYRRVALPYEDLKIKENGDVA